LIKEFALAGVKTYDINIIPDERGFFAEALRLDWKELIGEDQIVQANMSFSYPNMVRAWHRHVQGQVDYFLVLQGALKICAYDDAAESGVSASKLIEIIASSRKLQIVRIPGQYWHGYKNINNEPSFLIYFVNRIYNYQNPDEERRPWDDSQIIPVEINGNKNDPRAGKAWDWFYPPHK
jgi:dTDP-4-dehydrorhamnose 3,5-epimerase